MPLDDSSESINWFGAFAWFYGIRPELWAAAMRSYRKNRAKINKPHLVTLVDYLIPPNKPRLWILNFAPAEPYVVAHTWCAHGKGSGYSEVKVVGKHDRKSCVGGFVTGGTWKSALGQKDKKAKKTKYAMALYGLDPTNDNAHPRGIRWHGAHYVKPGSVAPSWGCISPPQEVNDAYVDMLSGGSFIFSYWKEEALKV